MAKFNFDGGKALQVMVGIGGGAGLGAILGALGRKLTAKWDAEREYKLAEAKARGARDGSAQKK